MMKFNLKTKTVFVVASLASLVLIVMICMLAWRVYFNNPSNNVDARFYDGKKYFYPGIDNKGLSLRFKFAVCGDPHIAAGNEGNFPLLNQIIAFEQLNFLVIPGDLTLAGSEAEYNTFKALLDATGIGYLVTVGNHDLYKNDWEIYKKIFGTSHYTFEISNALFVVIDTAGGRVGHPQMSWLEDTLKKNKKEHVFVITHEPVFSEKHSIFHLSDPVETQALKDLFAMYQVDYVLEGHYHGFVTIEDRGVQYVTSGSFGTGYLDNDVHHLLVFTVNGPVISFDKIDFNQPVTYQTQTTY